MSQRFWEFFAVRSLTLYYQLHVHDQHHGFMIVLTLLGDRLNIKSQGCIRTYIQSFQNCKESPTLPIDVFACHMKVCYSVYAKECPTKYRLESYLHDVLREASNCHLEKDSYKPRT